MSGNDETKMQFIDKNLCDALLNEASNFKQGSFVVADVLHNPMNTKMRYKILNLYHNEHTGALVHTVQDTVASIAPEKKR